MKLKNIQYYITVIVLIAIQLRAQNTNPEVTNVAFSVSGTTVSVTYNVTDALQTTVTISMLVSSDNGITWDFNYGTATGDIGAGVAIGTDKVITWTYSGVYNPNFKIRIYANDETAGGSPCPGIATVEYGGKTYNTIQIGTQCWLKENLDVGSQINGNQNPSNDGNIEKYCYNNDVINCNTYGGLYQWNEAMQYATTEGTRGICPTGWHIPTYTELHTLGAAVGNNSNVLKAIGQGTVSGTGTNTSGFSVLIAGYRNTNGSFNNLTNTTSLWSSTDHTSSSAYPISVIATDANIYFFTNYMDYGFYIRCIKNENGQGSIPSVPTLLSPTNMAIDQSTSPTLIWNESNGIEGYRLQVSTSDQFTTTVYDQSNITSTSQQVNDLSYSTQHYWRVNATNTYGTSDWSNVWSFKTGNEPCPGVPTVSYEGKTYNTVKIGTQCWLKENLDVGSMIQGNQNPANNSTIEKYCYNNDVNNCATYGGLYQWSEAMQYVTNEGTPGICPIGWHIPILAEFQTLYTTVLGDGNTLKAVGQGSGSGAGTNTSGFSALLAGNRNYGGFFEYFGASTYFWSSTELSEEYAYYQYLRYYNSIINLSYEAKGQGYSVRCLKD